MLTPTGKVFLPVSGLALLLGAIYKITSGDVLGGVLFLMVGAVVTRVPPGDSNQRCPGGDSCFFWLSRSRLRIRSTHRERGGVYMYLLCLDPEDLACPAGNTCKQLGKIVLV